MYGWSDLSIYLLRSCMYGWPDLSIYLFRSCMYGWPDLSIYIFRAVCVFVVFYLSSLYETIVRKLNCDVNFRLSSMQLTVIVKMLKENWKSIFSFKKINVWVFFFLNSRFQLLKVIFRIVLAHPCQRSLGPNRFRHFYAYWNTKKYDF